MECTRLRVKDLDFDQRQILARDAKGGKDRVTILPTGVMNRVAGECPEGML